MFQFTRYFLYMLVPLLVGLGAFQYLYVIFFEPFRPEMREMKLVQIQPETPLGDLCTELKRKGIIRETQSLCLYKQLSGSVDPIIPGEYELSPSMTPAQILAKLQKGDRFLRTIQVPEGATIWDLDELFAQAGLFNRHAFETAAMNPELLTRAGVAASSFEGYLGAGSYSFTRGTKPSTVLWDMLERAEQNNWNPSYSDKIYELRMTRHELLTLASIIHKATTDPQERRKVSSVLHNRLKNGMKLRSEEALVYAIRDFDGKLSDADKSLPSPYNTFLNYGLPPGPIVNPGNSAIEAALNPEKTDLLFYGKRQDGSLAFARSIKEFNQELNTER